MTIAPSCCKWMTVTREGRAASARIYHHLCAIVTMSALAASLSVSAVGSEIDEVRMKVKGVRPPPAGAYFQYGISILRTKVVSVGLTVSIRESGDPKIRVMSALSYMLPQAAVGIDLALSRPLKWLQDHEILDRAAHDGRLIRNRSYWIMETKFPKGEVAEGEVLVNDAYDKVTLQHVWIKIVSRDYTNASISRWMTVDESRRSRGDRGRYLWVASDAEVDAVVGEWLEEVPVLRIALPELNALRKSR